MSFQKLALNAELIQEISNSEQPDKLYKLNCTSRNIGEVEASIKKYNRLRCLILDFNYLERVSSLGSLFDLRELHIEGNMIAKIEGLETCKNLTVLNLAANRIEKIQKIQHLGKLQHLNLSKNKLQRITSLQTLKQLKTLNLSHNSIVSLQSLPSFSKLQTLLLNNNKIEKIPSSTFQNSLKLTKLDLSHNLLLQAQFISKLVSIQSLNLSHNHLQSFSTQQQLKSLQDLNLANNSLDTLQPIGIFFPQLSYLNLSHNMFCSQHQFITFLSQNQMLTEIEFVENPVTSESFEVTLFKLFNFDRINGKSYNQPGTKYYETGRKCLEDIRMIAGGEEDDEDDRKIMMSGFYNDELQCKLTGIKPHRPISPATRKAKTLLSTDLNDIQKSFQQFVQNDKRIHALRQIYSQICTQNNIQKPVIPEEDSTIYLTVQQQTKQLREGSLPESHEDQLNELRLRNDNNQKIINEAKKEKDRKWEQLKARTKERSFNIRKSRSKEMGNSLMKTGNNNDTRVPLSSQLMRTQLVPSKFNSTLLSQHANKTGSTFYRPSSQRKLPSNL